MKRAFCLIFLFALLFTMLPKDVSATSDTVYVSASGSDSNAGTESAPLKTWDKAMAAVSNGGTVRIVGTLSVSSWKSSGKNVTVTGGTLDLSAMSTVTFQDSLCFDAVTLNFKSGGAVYANGNRLVISENVTVNNTVTIYGGSNGGTVASADMTLLSGSYTAIYGGGNGGKVTGDVYLTVGGKVNPSADPSEHNAIYSVYGGGNNCTIGGSVYLVYTGSAKANYIYGGNSGGGTITGGTHVLMSGGQSMSIYGGSNGTDHKGNARLTFTGGSVEQVFGGSYNAGLTGNVTVQLLGGTVTRRVYGGCYNEAKRSGLSISWSSSYYVTGNVDLIVGPSASITYTYSDDDRSLYAHSRQKNLSGTENTTLILANGASCKQKAQDLAMQIIMAGVSVADKTANYTYSVSGNTITCSGGGTATLSVQGSSFTCNGSQVRPAKLTYSSDWAGGELSVFYTNNVNVGKATATVYAGGVSTSVSFDISKATQSAPSLSKTNETIRGKNDGTITGLTTDMEWSTNGTSYSPVTTGSMTVAPGTYYVRYAETPYKAASKATTVTVSQGRMLKITFKATGSADIVKEVAWNGTLTDIPAVPTRTGYDKVTPKWDVTNFSNIQQDMTVNAVYSLNTYTVTFVADGKTVSTVTVNHGGNAAMPQVPAKSGYTGSWNGTGTNITADTTITAVYTPISTSAPDPTETPEPTETVAPTEPTEPTETVAPTEPPEPTETVAPTEPPEPTETVKPTEPPTPTETVKPTETPESTETVAPSDTTGPTEAPAPTETTEPSETLPSETESPESSEQTAPPSASQPEQTTPSGTQGDPEDPQNGGDTADMTIFIVIGAVAAVAVILIVLLSRKKKKADPEVK